MEDKIDGMREGRHLHRYISNRESENGNFRDARDSGMVRKRYVRGQGK